MCPYFGMVWPAGKVLAHHLAAWDEPTLTDRFSGRVLELGCGLALPSLVLTARGIRVESTDQHPDVPAFLTRNRELNGLPGPTFRTLDWTQELGEETWTGVIASDVLYDKTQPDTLVRFLKKHIAANGWALIADPDRNYLESFISLADGAGFRVKCRAEFGVRLIELTAKS